MTAPHFFAGDLSGDRVALQGDDARHASRVLRLRPGERITISDGRGTVVEATVEEAGPGRLLAGVVSRRSEREPRPALRVFQAIPKKGKLDLVVQKLTELGVSSIALFTCERSIPRWDERKTASQTARLSEIARQAAMQSRRTWLPSLIPPAPLRAIELGEPSVVLEGSATARLTEAIPEAAPERLGLVVGPEGGLTEEELSALRDRGATPVSLGRPILRTETAALVAAAVVLARYGVLG